MKFFVGIVPPSNISEQISSIQDQFGNNRLEPHITLRPPVTLVNETKWLETVEDLCRNLSSFPIQLTGTGNFGKRVLFLEIQSTELIELEAKLTKAIKQFEEEQNKPSDQKHYHPHLTLGRSWCGFSAEDFKQMRILADQYLSKEPCYFTVGFLRIYYKPKNNEGYKIFKDVQLKR
jgi:2'-5' RNA ligase